MINNNNKNNTTKDIKIFGFWIYIMSDCIIFATLFATYAVLKNNIANGPSGKELFILPLVFIETICLLTSSLTYSFAMNNTHNNNKNKVIIWIIMTLMFGSIFIFIEFYEFHHLISIDCGPTRSAFLSIFFTLIGTHGLHVISGLIWMIIMILYIIKRGLIYSNKIRLQCLSLFWHFLDIIWICLFTTVYLIGKL